VRRRPPLTSHHAAAVACDSISSVSSPFSAVNQELGSFLQELDAFEQLIELVGTPSDGPDLQSQLGVRKSNLEYMQQRIELQLAGLAGYGDRDELDKVHRKLNNASNAHRMLLDSLASKEGTHRARRTAAGASEAERECSAFVCACSASQLSRRRAVPAGVLHAVPRGESTVPTL